VEFEPPPALRTLFGYSYLDLPPVRRVLIGEIPLGTGITVDLTGVDFLGVRLTSIPTVPGIPDGVDPHGAPLVTSGRACVVVVPTRFPDLTDP
jgi:hypothetical protein